MKLVSYNICSGKGADGVFAPRKSMEVLKNEAPDLIALQEVASCRPGFPVVDYLAEAEKFLAMHSLFGKTLNFPNGGEYGNGILSNFPLTFVELFPLDFPEEAEPRKALLVKVEAPRPFYMASLHLAFQGEFANDDEARKKALEKFSSHIQEKKYYPIIIAGDFNNPPDSPGISYMRENWDIANDLASHSPTAETGKYSWQEIDFIMSYPKGAFSFRDFARIDIFGPSDHYPVTAEFELV